MTSSSTPLVAARRALRARRERTGDRALAAVGTRSGRVVIGPWTSEVGFELLYWIPLVRRALTRNAVDPARVTVVTRGGAAAWYADLAAHDVEIYDLMPPEELAERNAADAARSGTQKQLQVGPVDAEILRRAGAALDEDAELVHPRVLYRAMRYVWGAAAPLEEALSRLSFTSLPTSTAAPALRAALPDRYVAVKLYFSDCFPDTRENRAFADRVIATLAERTTVVLLSTGRRHDDHVEVPGKDRPGVLFATDLMTARDNLAVQSAIVAGADRVIGTYGGFSYLGPFLGVPSSSFWSHETFNHVHLEVMRHAARTPGAADFDARPIDRFEVPA